MAQKLKPTKNDWVLEVEKNLKEINLNISEKQLKKMSKIEFKILAREDT